MAENEASSENKLHEEHAHTEHHEHPEHHEQPKAVHPSRTKLALHRKLMAVYTIVGIVIGYISYIINAPLYNLVLMIIVGIIMTIAVKKVLNVSAGGKRWWGTGVTVYVFVWLVVWTIFYNIYVVKP